MLSLIHRLFRSAQQITYKQNEQETNKEQQTRGLLTLKCDREHAKQARALLPRRWDPRGSRCLSYTRGRTSPPSPDLSRFLHKLLSTGEFWSSGDNTRATGAQEALQRRRGGRLFPHRAGYTGTPASSWRAATSGAGCAASASCAGPGSGTAGGALPSSTQSDRETCLEMLFEFCRTFAGSPACMGKGHEGRPLPCAPAVPRQLQQ